MESQRGIEGERRVAADQWDVDGWHILAAEAEKVSLDDAQPIYERLVAQFPPLGKFWRAYVEHYVREKPDDHQQIIAIYERAVKDATTSIDLWKSYLAFSTSLAVKVPGSKLEADAISVHERALKSAGLDMNSHPLWAHYIDFIKKHTSFSDSQRRDALRRVYQRSVRNPMQNLDNFWRDYTNFEQTSNNSKEYARTTINESQPKNIDARAEFRARRMRREGLTISALPVPPRGRAKETSQAQLWRKVIAAEKDNRSSLADTDLKERVIHAYECALGPMYRYPDFWIEYMTYVYNTFTAELVQQAASKGNGSNGKENATNAKDSTSPAKTVAVVVEPILERAVRAVPSNVAVHLHASWLYARIEDTSKAVSVLDTLCSLHPSPLAYVHLMKAARKFSSRDAARKVFGKARKDPKGSHPCVYVAAARMEFAMKESKVAKNVFEFGLKNFANSALIAGEYVQWLWGVGDFEYARVVLKKVMPNADGSANEIRRLWETWLELEEVIGDAASADKVEVMWKESTNGKNNSVLGDALRRARFLNFEGMNEDELAAFNNRASKTEDVSGQQGAGGGRRDPRTGKRVASSNATKDNSKNNGSQRQNSDGASKGSTTVKGLTEALNRLVTLTPPVPPIAPPPAVDMLFKLLRDTPDDISDIPSYRRTKNGTGKNQENVSGKKRKSEELQSAAVGSTSTGAPQPQDVFQARQAAKQSRTR